jgi:hypothetical protein
MVILYWLCAILEWNNSEPIEDYEHLNDSDLSCDSDPLWYESIYKPIMIEPTDSIPTDYFFFNEETGDVHKI